MAVEQQAILRVARHSIDNVPFVQNWMLQLGFQRKASQPGSSSEAAPSAVEPQQRRAEAAASGQGVDADQFQQQGNSTPGEPASTGHGLDGHIMASVVSGDHLQAEISGGVTGSTQVRLVSPWSHPSVVFDNLKSYLCGCWKLLVTPSSKYQLEDICELQARSILE
jgi:hypothetical protein